MPEAALNKAKMMAARPPDMGTVTNQASTIFLNIFQSTAWRDLTQPTLTTAPTCLHLDGCLLRTCLNYKLGITFYTKTILFN